MKSLFNPEHYQAIRRRIDQLNPQSNRVWGKMEIDQMLAHCNRALDQGIGRIPFKDKSNFLLRTLVRQLVLKGIKKEKIGRGTATFPEFVITDRYDFDTEKKQLLDNLETFYSMRAQFTDNRHPHFGRFNQEQFGGFHHLHVDHHLKQFGV